MQLLEVRNLCKSYKKLKALSDMTFSVGAGEIVALIGKNGAGKTTLLNCIAGNIQPTGGDIIYKGETLLKNESGLNEFGILIEPTFIPYMNAYENLSILLKTSDVREVKKTAEDLLKLVGLSHKQKEKTKAFSFGMRQRLGLAQALLNNPKFLVLDEPFVGLDPAGKTILKNIILQKAHEEKIGILFSSHDLEDVEEICDRIIMIEGGKKVYDGIVEYDKQYILISDKSINQEKIPALTGYLVEENRVTVPMAEQLGNVFEALTSAGVFIKDLEVRRKSLYDFFE